MQNLGQCFPFWIFDLVCNFVTRWRFSATRFLFSFFFPGHRIFKSEWHCLRPPAAFVFSCTEKCRSLEWMRTHLGKRQWESSGAATHGRPCGCRLDWRLSVPVMVRLQLLNEASFSGEGESAGAAGSGTETWGTRLSCLLVVVVVVVFGWRGGGSQRVGDAVMVCVCLHRGRGGGGGCRWWMTSP